MSTWFPAHNYTPTDVNSLQAVVPVGGAYTDLATGDMAFVYEGGELNLHYYDSTSAVAESIPSVVTSDGNAGNGRWLKKGFGGVATPEQYTSPGAISPSKLFVELDSSGEVSTMAMTYAAPIKGSSITITCTDATEDITVTLTAGNFYFISGGIDDSGNVATFNTAGQTLTLFAVSATQFNVVQNIGQVGII